MTRLLDHLITGGMLGKTPSRLLAATRPTGCEGRTNGQQNEALVVGVSPSSNETNILIIIMIVILINNYMVHSVSGDTNDTDRRPVRLQWFRGAG